MKIIAVTIVGLVSGVLWLTLLVVTNFNAVTVSAALLVLLCIPQHGSI